MQYYLAALTYFNYMELSDRIEALVNYSALSIPQFAAAVGFKTPQAVRELIKGRTKTLSDSAQYKITSRFPEVSPTWLLTGEGAMLVTPESNAHEVEVDDDNTLRVEFVPISAYATFLQAVGTPAWSYNANMDFVNIIATPDEIAHAPELKVFEVEGDSMLPTLRAHAQILTRIIPPSKWHYAKGVCVVAYDEYVVVKRITANTLESVGVPQYLTLTSDNRHHGSITVARCDIRAIFRATRIVSSEIS